MMRGVPTDPPAQAAAPRAAGQSLLGSALEAFCGTGFGFALSILLQWLLFPALGHSFSLDENVMISLAFTALSVTRSFLVRRLFNRWSRAAAVSPEPA